MELAKFKADDSYISFDAKPESDSSGISKETWYYLVWSIKLVHDTTSTPKKFDTEVEYFIDNTAQAAKKTWTNTYISDETGFKNYLGNDNSASANYTSRLNGFIYRFAIIQNAHSASDTSIANAGCHASSGNTCWTISYDKYKNRSDATTDCDASCKPGTSI
jgi:hypothetical protein